VRVIAAGIDSLYASARGTVHPDHLATALERRTAAAEAGEPAMWSLDAIEETFLVRPHGTRCFPVWATSGAMDVWLGDRQPFPAVHLRLFSRFIHRVGIEQAVARAERLVTALVPPRAVKVPHASVLRPEVEAAPTGPLLTTSRVDVYADTQGWEPRREDYSRFVSRAAHRRQWEDRAHPIHMLGDVLTGFTFGQRDIVGRIYDKGREHAKRGEDWLEVIWDDRDPKQPVWRIEFQLRRKALKTFRLGSVAEVLAARQELWNYGTSWLSLRTPTRDSNRSRWPEDPVWCAVRAARIGSPCSALVRERVRGADAKRLLRGLAGYATSLAALKPAVGLEDAVRDILPALQAYLAERGTTFHEVSARKRGRRLDG
jgi:hypothetical protein